MGVPDTVADAITQAVTEAVEAERQKWLRTFENHVYVPDDEYAALCDAVRATGAKIEVVLARMRLAERQRTQNWRNDAFETAAGIAERYGQTHVAGDIRALITVAS